MKKNEDNDKPQSGLNLEDASFSDPLDFHRTYKEFPKHEKLIRNSSFSQLFGERPNTAKDTKEEKAINTSKESYKPTVSDKVSDLVNCPICLDMIEDAMETPCCHNIFCEGCIIRTDLCPI